MLSNRRTVFVVAFALIGLLSGKFASAQYCAVAAESADVTAAVTITKCTTFCKRVSDAVALADGTSKFTQTCGACTAVAQVGTAAETACATPSAVTFCPYSAAADQAAGYTGILVPCMGPNKCRREAAANGVSPTLFGYKCSGACTAVAGAAGAKEVVCSSPFVSSGFNNKASFSAVALLSMIVAFTTLKF